MIKNGPFARVNETNRRQRNFKHGRRIRFFALHLYSSVWPLKNFISDDIWPLHRVWYRWLRSRVHPILAHDRSFDARWMGLDRFQCTYTSNPSRLCVSFTSEIRFIKMDGNLVSNSIYIYSGIFYKKELNFIYFWKFQIRVQGYRNSIIMIWTTVTS